MTKTESARVLQTLKARFETHPERHAGLAWAEVEARLKGNAAALTSLDAMDTTGGEPDVIGHDPKTGELTFCDCAAESPAGRRSLCFDGEARLSRKENRPEGSAAEMAEQMGVTLLTEAEYRHLQTLGAFDTKTSSWVQTPAAIRALGGALFCDRRYNAVFVYHNGAQSYYGARGFRALLKV